MSTNVERHRTCGPARVLQSVARIAGELGVGVGAAELVGFAPDSALGPLRYACAGLGIPLLAAANLATTGSPLPIKMLPGAVDLAAQAGPSLWGVVLPQSPLYPLELLFGTHGLFLVSPVLLLGAWGLARARRRPPLGDGRAWGWIAAGILAQFAGHALVAGSYGGWSFGYRYLIPIQPLLMLAAPAALVTRPARALGAALLPVSMLFAALGAYHPWPPAFEQASAGDPVAALVSNPIGGNAAAFAAAHRPGGALAERLGRRYISPDPELRRRYLALFFGSKGDLATRRRFLP